MSPTWVKETTKRPSDLLHRGQEREEETKTKGYEWKHHVVCIDDEIVDQTHRVGNDFDRRRIDRHLHFAHVLRVHRESLYAVLVLILGSLHHLLQRVVHIRLRELDQLRNHHSEELLLVLRLAVLEDLRHAVQQTVHQLVAARVVVHLVHQELHNLPGLALVHHVLHRRHQRRYLPATPPRLHKQTHAATCTFIVSAFAGVPRMPSNP